MNSLGKGLHASHSFTFIALGSAAITSVCGSQDHSINRFGMPSQQPKRSFRGSTKPSSRGMFKPSRRFRREFLSSSVAGWIAGIATVATASGESLGGGSDASPGFAGRVWNLLPLGNPAKKEDDKLRIGMLGAGKVGTYAMIWPARRRPDCEIVAVAARDSVRARKYADSWGIEKSYGSYQALIDDPNVDAVYVALPNGRHGEWTEKALAAGKHVLCEKPFAANAEEAARIDMASQKAGKVCWEAMHWRHHPVASRLRQLAQGKLGELRHIKARFLVPPPAYSFPSPEEIRFRYALGGGALMDLGCYPVDIVRYISGQEPQVLRASAKPLQFDERVDGGMKAELKLPSGATAEIECSFFGPWSASYWGSTSTVDAEIFCDNGNVRCENYLSPHFAHRIGITCPAKRFGEKPSRTEEFQYGDGSSTYGYQLRNFIKAVRGQPITSMSTLPTAYEAVKGMEVIDGVYQAAGLSPRESSRNIEELLSDGKGGDTATLQV